MDRRIWNSNTPMGPMDDGARARLVHSLWLTRALESGREYPRIPVRPVVTGGFSRLLARSNGRQLADRWWQRALARLED